MTKREILEEFVTSLGRVFTTLTENGQPDDAPSGYYSDSQVQKILGVGQRRLREFRHAKLVDFVKIGRKIYYPKDSIENLLKSKKVTAMPDSK